MRVGCVIFVTQLIHLCLSSGQDNIPSFTVSSQIRPNESILVDSDVVLSCSVKTSTSKPIKIYKLGHNLSYNCSLHQENLWICVKRKVTCDDMGTYVCDVDGHLHEADLLIYDCPPRHCPGDDTNRTLFIRDRVEFSLCVLAFPGLYEYMDFMNNSLRKKTVNPTFNWDFFEIKPTNHSPWRQFHIKVKINILKNYDLQRLHVYSLAAEPEYDLTYYLFFTNESASASTTYQTTSQRNKDNPMIRGHSTSAGPNDTDKGSLRNIVLAAAIAATMGGLLVLSLCLYCFCRARRRQAQERQMKDDALYSKPTELGNITHRNTSQDPGFTISSEGLKYVEVTHVQKNKIKQWRLKKKTPQDNVIYSKLKFFQRT